MRITARREEQERSPHRRLQLRLVELDIAAAEQRERRPQVGFRARLFELRERGADIHGWKARPSRYIAGRSTGARSRVVRNPSAIIPKPSTKWSQSSAVFMGTKFAPLSGPTMIP